MAIDAEFGDAPIPPALAARYGDHDFWQRWTRVECAVKLSGLPLPVWLRRYGLQPSPDYFYRTFRASWLAPGLVVTVALAEM